MHSEGIEGSNHALVNAIVLARAGLTNEGEFANRTWSMTECSRGERKEERKTEGGRDSTMPRILDCDLEPKRDAPVGGIGSIASSL